MTDALVQWVYALVEDGLCAFDRQEQDRAAQICISAGSADSKRQGSQVGTVYNCLWGKPVSKLKKRYRSLMIASVPHVAC
jgi:hypothetical protein